MLNGKIVLGLNWSCLYIPSTNNRSTVTDFIQRTKKNTQAFHLQSIVVSTSLSLSILVLHNKCLTFLKKSFDSPVSTHTTQMCNTILVHKANNTLDTTTTSAW